MKYLVIHEDSNGTPDVAEVDAVDARTAANEVAAYADTIAIHFVVGFEGPAPSVFARNGLQLTPTEGDALAEG